ncbi:MAG: immunoglobulin-like domain-containing protein [Bacteroidota bacterium]
MKGRCYFIVMTAIAVIVLSACKKDSDTSNDSHTSTDFVKPVITLAGQNPQVVTQFSAVSYADPGATALDDVNGNVAVTASGSVNMNLAGNYTRSYTASDAAGNTAIVSRVVVVNGAAYLEGSYNVQDYTGSTFNGNYTENLNSSFTINNKIVFATFANYAYCPVYGIVSGTTITIPSQTVNCGVPSADHTFSGAGSYINNFSTFTINYTEITNGTSATGYGVYSRN